MLVSVSPSFFRNCEEVTDLPKEIAFFGWAQYESIAFTQLGVPQQDLGFSGGLAGMARYAGGESQCQLLCRKPLTW